MALRKWSIIEEELKKTGTIHPLLLKCLGEMHERHRVQHEQIMKLASLYGGLIDQFNSVVQAMGHVGAMMRKEDASDKMNELEGDPDEAGSTWHDMRDPNKKN